MAADQEPKRKRGRPPGTGQHYAQFKARMPAALRDWLLDYAQRQGTTASQLTREWIEWLRVRDSRR